LDAPAEILIVEPDIQILMLVAKFLRENGFHVHIARNPFVMAEILEGISVDLIVLDLLLPGKRGLEICRELRRTSSVPIIMLTAACDETDRVICLEAGADDCLQKAFNPRDLLECVGAVLRRNRITGNSAAERAIRRFVFAGWSLDTMKRELTAPNGVVVDLSSGEYNLLLAFLEAPQRMLSREFLLNASRHRAIEGGDRSIDVQVRRLHRKLDGHEELIKTIHLSGYLFAPHVVCA
jgi:two-component system OmpR family response regulator